MLNFKKLQHTQHKVQEVKHKLQCIQLTTAATLLYSKTTTQTDITQNLVFFIRTMQHRDKHDFFTKTQHNK